LIELLEGYDPRRDLGGDSVIGALVASVINSATSRVEEEIATLSSRELTEGERLYGGDPDQFRLGRARDPLCCRNPHSETCVAAGASADSYVRDVSRANFERAQDRVESREQIARVGPISVQSFEVQFSLEIDSDRGGARRTIEGN
jgi:hypothetical protein